MKRNRLLRLYMFASCFLLFVFYCENVFSQKTKEKAIITGTVKDELETKLENVVIHNLKSGAVAYTNKDGYYQIQATQGDSIEATLVGYNPFYWQFNDRIVFDIPLTAVSGSENDVVVVGYGTQKKISLTGAQSTVKADELKHPVANLSTMLAGRISGLIGVQRSGLPGSNSADIWIRGISTFGGSNSSSPLIIVDGVQGRGINDFDPEDIESFTILKDASATAVYGAQGANGVIIITTKKGTVGKVNLMVNYNEGITAFTKKPEMASAKDYMELRNEAMIASGLAPAYTQDYIDSTLDPTANHYVYPNVDWIDLLFNKVSSNRRLNFSARGGTENTQFYTSVSYYDESSLLKTDGLQNFNATTRFQRFNYVSNVDMKWTKTTKFYLGITGYVTNFNEPYNGAESAFSNAMGASPVLYPAVYPGNLVAGISMGGTPSPNPWADITQSGYNNTFGNKIASTLRLNQDFSFWLKGLSAEAMYSFDTYTTNTQSKRRNNSVYYLNQSQPYNQDGTLNLNQVIAKNGQLDFFSSYGQSRQYTLQGQIMYNRTFGAHNVYGMLVYNQISTPNPSADNATDAIPVRTQNYATRATYSYLNKYLFEFNGAFTGSQVFSPEHRYGFFPSWSIGWVLSNEKYWKAIDKYVQFFKLRYSNGFSGAIGGSRYDYLTTIGSANGITFGQSGTGGVNKSYSGLNYTHYGADVRWAKSHDQDLGVEFKILNNQLSFVLDWFKKYRTGVFLTRANFPSFAGLQYNPDGNYGITLNQGFDGTVDLSPIPLAKDLSISFRGTFTYNKDKLIENGAAPYEEPWMDPRGQNINSSQGYVAEGIFQSQAEIDNHADQSGVGGNARVGDLKYKDLNGDGIINVYDQTTINHGDVPRWIFGFGFNLNYKQFYISAFFQGNYGAQRAVSDIARAPFADGAYGNVLANTTDRWTEENHATNPFYPRLGYGTSATANNDVASSWWVKDISFIRFKTLDMGYNLPKGAFRQIGLKNARIYFSGVNLLYWSKFKLWDPEMNTGNGGAYPNTRTFSLGIQANF